MLSTEHTNSNKTPKGTMAVTTASVVVRLLLCTGVYYVVARRVTALNEVWTSVKRRGIHCIFEATECLLRLCSLVRMISKDDGKKKTSLTHTNTHTTARAKLGRLPNVRRYVPA